MFLWSKYRNITVTVFSIVLYFIFSYFIERTEFHKILTLWVLLFSCYYFLINNKQLSFSSLLGISILFRLIFLFATPNLSQDFYRFIWDGRLLFQGINPYLSLPENFIQQGNFIIPEAKNLYEGMGELSRSNYTNYPPINQLNFLIAALLSSKSILGSIIVLRLQIILADIGIIYFGKKLLKKLHLSARNIFWYALNPFIIIEMTGNLHFEPVMLFFLIWSLYQLHQKKWLIAAILLGCSISVKLIPLLFIPLFFQYFFTEKDSEKPKINLKKSSYFLLFYFVILLTVGLLFLPFYSEKLITNYFNSVSLWFRYFEFNASIYYIFKEIGYLFRGYNEIAIIGKINVLLVILFLVIITFFRKNKSIIELITAFLLAISFYYFTSTTVHPWYIATPLILSVFTKYKFPIVWSFALILSYQAYANTPWKENLFLIALQYFIVYAAFYYEIRKTNNNKSNI